MRGWTGAIRADVPRAIAPVHGDVRSAATAPANVPDTVVSSGFHGFLHRPSV